MEQVTLDDTRITLELARVEGSEALQEEDSAEDVAQVPGVQEIILHQAVGPALLQKRHTELCNLEEQASSSASSEIIDSSRLIVSDKVSSSDPAQPVSVPSGQMPSFSSPPSEQGSFVDVSSEDPSPSQQQDRHDNCVLEGGLLRPKRGAFVDLLRGDASPSLLSRTRLLSEDAASSPSTNNGKPDMTR